MKVPIRIQGLGLVEEVTVVEWKRENGEAVRAGDELLVVETEKATVVITVPADGVLEISIPAGPELVAADAILGFVAVASAE